MTSGVRYGLFLCDTSHSSLASIRVEVNDKFDVDNVVKSMQYLNKEATKMMKFYQASVEILKSTTDDALTVECENYQQFIESANLRDRYDISALSPLGQLLHHILLLHPSSYHEVKNNVMKLRELNLVMKAKQHMEFMIQLLKVQESCDLDHATFETLIEDAVKKYSNFLISLKQEKGKNYHRPVPSMLVDHIWHTHMNDPVQYAMDCLRLCGHVVDHRVEEET